MQLPEPFVEPTGRRIRVRLGSRLVADSVRAQLLVRYGPEGLPTYFIPMDDVVAGALTDEQQSADGARRWTVAAGRSVAPGAAWSDPPGTFPELDGHVTFSWRALEWFEEDERVLVHARDPHKRVDTLRSSRHVEVRLGRITVAASVRPLLLFETSLPVRYYLPFEDIRTELFEASDLVTMCPYKGTARYWSVRAGEVYEPDLAWSYPDPIPENPKIKDLVCFFNERVDLVVDGALQERPSTPWSQPPSVTVDGTAGIE
jgi:uncharacterized protein (DUF427 family)